MEITEVRIKLIDNTEDRLRGFCSVTFDNAFVVRDLKIIEGNKGPFVAMPSRKLTANCHKCRTKNHLRANYCNQCGAKVRTDRVEHDAGGRAKLYADVAHPVNAQCREMIQNRVIEELNKEVALSQMPGYSSRYDDDYFDDDPGPAVIAEPAPPALIDVPSEILEIKAEREREQKSESNQAKPGIKRRDSGQENQHKPHSPEDGLTDADLTQGTDSADEGFGKGIFE